MGKSPKKNSNSVCFIFVFIGSLLLGISLEKDSLNVDIAINLDLYDPQRSNRGQMATSLF
jgi:hypothetical protein